MYKEQEKLQLIKDNQDACIAAIESYLDSMYTLTDKYFNENGDFILENSVENDGLVDFIKSIRQDINKYEILRRKIKDKDFNITYMEIMKIGFAFSYCEVNLKNQSKNLAAASEMAGKICATLFEGEKPKEN